MDLFVKPCNQITVKMLSDLLKYLIAWKRWVLQLMKCFLMSHALPVLNEWWLTDKSGIAVFTLCCGLELALELPYTVQGEFWNKNIIYWFQSTLITYFCLILPNAIIWSPKIFKTCFHTGLFQLQLCLLETSRSSYVKSLEDLRDNHNKTKYTQWIV